MTMGDRIFFTDNLQWRNGISRIGPSFLIPNTQKNRKLFVVGNRLKIPNTDERVITGVAQNGVYLILSHSGEILDIEKVGLPSKFQVIGEGAEAPL